jgi:hypothetical protein
MVVYHDRVLSTAYPRINDGGLPSLIAAWIEANETDILRAYNLGWGWEVWAQVQLCFHINTFLGGPAATRNARIYGNEEMSDIAVYNDAVTIQNGELTTQGKLIHGIELKCRSINGNANTFRNLLYRDYTKVVQNHFKWDHKETAKSTVVGINVGDNPAWDTNFKQGDWTTKSWQTAWPAGSLTAGPIITLFYRAGLW